jgi:hypothetical protein
VSGEKVPPPVPDVRMCGEAKENLFKLAVHAQGGVYVI